MMIGRLAFGWLTVVTFQVAGGTLLSNLGSPLISAALLAWLLGAVFYCAFGVIEEAEHLADKLGEPSGTLILTLTIVGIEVILISALMLGGDAAPTVGRDTMFAVMMIVLNFVIGLALVLGGLRHHEQSYSLPGASAFLSVIIPFATIALVLPTVTSSTSDGTLTNGQAIVFSLATAALYALFLRLQTGRHRDFFIHGTEEDQEEEREYAAHPRAVIIRHSALLVACVLPIVLLSKPLGKVIGSVIEQVGAPTALTGMMVALIVFTPEGVAALRAAYRNELQRTVNLCLGAFLSTIGLTLPAVLMIGLITGTDVVLGLDATGIVLLSLTLLLSVVTFSGRATVLEGAVHLLVFVVYLVLLFSP